MEKVKRYWKEVTILILAILFISNCTGKGNYRRKYEKQIIITEHVADSLTNMYEDSGRYIDSLNQVIKDREKDIDYLEKQISIYKDQNTKLANKPVRVIVNQESKQ